MDILKFSKRPADLLAADEPAVAAVGPQTTDHVISKQILDAPTAKSSSISHPLQSETSMRPTLEKFIHTRRALGGGPQAEKLILELASAAQFNRGPPGCDQSSRLHYDMLLGRDDQIGYGDYFNRM